MKIVLIAPGFSPFPPKGWGAVESIVWDYYENLKTRKYDVHIVNTSDTQRIIHETNAHCADIVHVMYDNYINVVPFLKARKIYYTSHYAYITHPLFEKNFTGYYNDIFKKVIEHQKYITINAISHDIAEMYRKKGFAGDINVVCNGAREDCFRFTNAPINGTKSVYLAKVEYRKGQYKYQNIPNIDFIGNYHDSSFDVHNPNYKGEWSREKIYENLTDYGNLILLSDGEADPLVVKEALIAGLGVVLSECSTANLDLTKPYITVIPTDKLYDIEYVAECIAVNRLKSIEHRDEIREYGLSMFGWSNVIDLYTKIIFYE